MKIKSRISHQGKRKHAEVPKAVRDDFYIGEEVYILKKTDSLPCQLQPTEENKDIKEE